MDEIDWDNVAFVVWCKETEWVNAFCDAYTADRYFQSDSQLDVFVYDLQHAKVAAVLRELGIEPTQERCRALVRACWKLFAAPRISNGNNGQGNA